MITGDTTSPPGAAAAGSAAARQAGTRVGFLRWVSDTPSGGNRYDDEATANLRDLGWDVREYRVSGNWPLTGDSDRRQVAGLLAAERIWMVDNIVATGAPHAIRDAAAACRRVIVVVHYFPSDEPLASPAQRQRLVDDEVQSVRAASAVVCTSEWSATEVARRYEFLHAVVAVPGVASAPVSPGTLQPPRLLALGRVTRTKNQLGLVQALSRLTDLQWTARLVGPDTIDLDYTAEVRNALDAAGLADRVQLTGARVQRDLDDEWTAADLLVLPSLVEPYGMVVTEALARGLPSVVPAGTGAAQAQRTGSTHPDETVAGTIFEPGISTVRGLPDGPGTPTGTDEPGSLAAVLRTWLTDGAQRAQWRSAALRQRAALPTWRATAEILAGCLAE